MEKVPRAFGSKGEIMPAESMGRGDMRSIVDQISFFEDQANRPGRQRYAVEVNDLGPLHAAHHEGFNIILRLPRANEAACVRKYGPYYDKLASYIEFIHTLAQRNNIHHLKHFSDSYWLFEKKEDAELLSRKLIEKQEAVELEFEVIEGS